jgi:hypothetical protein
MGIGALTRSVACSEAADGKVAPEGGSELMAPRIRQHDPAHDGTLEVEEAQSNFVKVYFVPPERSLLAAGLNPSKARSYRTKLLDIHGQDSFLTIYPISTFGDRSDLKPKYSQIERITLDDADIIFPGCDGAAPTTPDDVLEVLEELPSAFTKDYPVIKVRDQASVGGRKLSGDGEKITDFFVKNSLTNNTAIFEIKTPRTAILNKTPFRDGVFTPSTDLSGSINQALDQKYQFQKQIAQIKDNTRLYDIESYTVHCCLVIGRTPDGNDQTKSFELFRRNSRDVEIVTFDELLGKLKQLSTFLRAADESTESQEAKGDANG